MKILFKFFEGFCDQLRKTINSFAIKGQLAKDDPDTKSIHGRKYNNT